MKTIQGDVLKFAEQGMFDVVVHGCNCFCTMGSGIAGQIHRDYPEAYETDCKTIKGDKNKLGTFTQTIIIKNGIQFIIVNGYTQYNYGRSAGELYVDYNAIRNVFKEVKKQFGNLRIAYPKIGCGLANGDWNIVSKIIDEELNDSDHTYVEYPN